MLIILALQKHEKLHPHRSWNGTWIVNPQSHWRQPSSCSRLYIASKQPFFTILMATITRWFPWVPFFTFSLLAPREAQPPSLCLTSMETLYRSWDLYVEIIEASCSPCLVNSSSGRWNIWCFLLACLSKWCHLEWSQVGTCQHEFSSGLWPKLIAQWWRLLLCHLKMLKSTKSTPSTTWPLLCQVSAQFKAMHCLKFHNFLFCQNTPLCCGNIMWVCFCATFVII